MRKELFTKARQKSRQNPFYRELMLKLTQAVSVENHKIKLFRPDCMQILVYFCRVSFLTILDIYKDYFKGHHACRKWQSSLFSLKKLLHLYAKGFVIKELSDIHCWWTEELWSQQPFQVARVSHVLGFVYHWLVTYWDSCIE